MSDPRLTAEAQSQNPASAWEAKPGFNSGMTASARDYSGNYARGTVRDGQVVSAETGATSRGSTAYASAPAEQSARAVDYAMDPRTGCRIPLSDMDDNSVVYFTNGASVSARYARQLGWLHDPSPSRVEQPAIQPEQHQQQQEQAKTETHPDLDAQAFADPAAEASLDQLVKGTTGMEQISAVNEIIQSGEISAQTLGRLASQLRQEPGQVQEQLAPIMKAFETQARAVMSEGGLNSDDVVAWAQKHQPDALNRAMHRQATLRTVAGYAALAREYRLSLGEHNPSAALNADLGPGITTYQDAKGRVMVRIPGQGEMLWRQAMQAYGPK